MAQQQPQADDAPPPPWWDDDMLELIQRRAPMPSKVFFLLARDECR
jgi:hypothetical protein